TYAIADGGGDVGVVKDDIVDGIDGVGAGDRLDPRQQCGGMPAFKYSAQDGPVMVLRAFVRFGIPPDDKLWKMRKIPVRTEQRSVTPVDHDKLRVGRVFNELKTELPQQRNQCMAV